MDRHQHIRAQLTDYALGELPPTERHEVVTHVAECAECAAEARELLLAFESIGLTEDPVEPPAHLKARVLSNLEREAGSKPGPIVLPFSEPRTPTRWNSAWLAVAAMAVLVLGGLLIVAQQRAGRLAAEINRLEDDTARLTREAAAIAGQADLVVAILTSTDMRRIDLEGFDVSRNATARAYWSGTKGLLIVADRLPTPPPGRTYQVWLIAGGAGPVSAGLIDGRRAGRGMLIVPPPAGVTGNSVTIAVTDEPEGGLPGPTGSKHLVGSI